MSLKVARKCTKDFEPDEKQVISSCSAKSPVGCKDMNMVKSPKAKRDEATSVENTFVKLDAAAFFEKPPDLYPETGYDAIGYDAGYGATYGGASGGFDGYGATYGGASGGFD